MKLGVDSAVNDVTHHYHGLGPSEIPLKGGECVALAEKAGLRVVHQQPILDRLLLVVCRKKVRMVEA